MQQPDFRPLAARLTHLSPGELADVRKAFDFAVEAHKPQKREDGTPYVSHVIAVADIVAGWGADRDTVIAALLHDVIEDTPVKKDEIMEKFGRHVGLLVEGITKFNQADLSPDLPLDRKIETLRKLFDVMRLDIRSILIKLADRLHNVQTIDALPTPERRRRFALETLSIYYKITYHLGMRSLRRALAESCVPHAFDCGADDKVMRDRFCKEHAGVVGTLQHELLRDEGNARVLKVEMHAQNLTVFHERRVEKGGEALPQDAFTISIVVRSEEDCYHLLKTLHTLHRPASGQFRDFIAAPDETGYQSLHTHVAMKDGTIVEVRIRTREMEERADAGITVWLFRGESHIAPSFSWLQRSANLDLKTRDSSGAFWEALESDILRETISITVGRRRLSLPKGATALDAAYAAYNARANHAAIFTINGRQLPASEPMKEDDELHVTFDPNQQATFDWLQSVSTHFARFHIVDALKRTSRSEKISLGATLLQKEFDHYSKGLLSGLSRTQCQYVADHFKRDTFDQVLAMIGEGVIRARDVVFYLYPDHKRSHFLLLRSTPGRYRFQIHLRATRQPGEDVLSRVNGIIRTSDVMADTIRIEGPDQHGMVDVFLSGHSSDRLQFADFMDAMERQEWVSDVQTLLPPRQKFFLLGAMFLAFFVIVADLILFPAYQQTLEQLSTLPRFIIQALPLIPILAVNYYLVRLLRAYVVRLRSDRWYLGIGMLLNIIGLMMLVLRILLMHSIQASLLPLIIVFSASLLYMGYTFFQTDALFASLEHPGRQPRSTLEMSALQRRKTMGYAIRLFAVLIWGLEPIYIRYTAVNDLTPFLRTFLLGFGVLIPSVLLYVCQNVWSRRRWPSFALPYDSAFLLLVIGQMGYMYFKNASLIYTTGTNLLLFNNFSPLIGLIIATFFWRKDIAYLRQPRTMLIILLLAISAGLGSSLLVYNNVGDTSLSVFGDALAMVSTFFDVFMTIGQIQYIRHFSRTNGMLLNIHIFFFLLCFTAPVIIAGPLLGFPLLRGLDMHTLMLGLGIGLFVGIGQFLNYEAFKRIDGYLAYMMFNLSVLITFTMETFLIHSVTPSVLLIISGLLIIGSSVAAEIVNSRCEQKGF